MQSLADFPCQCSPVDASLSSGCSGPPDDALCVQFRQLDPPGRETSLAKKLVLNGPIMGRGIKSQWRRDRLVQFPDPMHFAYLVHPFSTAICRSFLYLIPRSIFMARVIFRHFNSQEGAQSFPFVRIFKSADVQ